MPPTLDSDLISRTPVASLSVALEPAQNVLNSMVLLTAADKFSGLDEWVTRTAAQLAPAERHRNALVCEGLYFAVQPDRRWPSFSSYLDDLAARDAVELRDRLLWNLSRACISKTPPGAQPATLVEPATLLSSADAYIRYLQDNSFEFDLALETEAHALFSDPSRMKDLIISHIIAGVGRGVPADRFSAYERLRSAAHGHGPSSAREVAEHHRRFAPDHFRAVGALGAIPAQVQRR